LVKTVVNNNGGTAKTTDFTLSAAGPTPIAGAGGAEADVNAGSYALSESGPAGYTAGAWSCTGGSLEGATVTLGLGQSATCTITNDDQAVLPPPPPPTPPPPTPPPPAPAAPPPPTAPTPQAVSPLPIAPPFVEPVAVVPDEPAELTLIRDELRRAFVPGQPVRLDGTAPADCRPTLRVDGQMVGPVEIDRAGRYTVDVDTTELAAGRHLAEILCPGGMIRQTGFWVAAPQTSSSTLSVVLVVLLVLGALGWVSIRGLTSRTRAAP
jgi:hypothetical protein